MAAWYQTAKQRHNLNYEEKIIKSDAERYIRQLYFLRGTLPEQEQVDLNVERIFKRLVDKFGSIINIRTHLDSNTLQDVLEQDGIVDKLPY